MSELIELIFLFLALFTLAGIVTLIFIHLYQIIKEPSIQKRMRQLRKPVQPWVTVLLYSRKDSNLTAGTLRSLLRSYYHNFDIVIVNDFSNDATNALKKGYAKSLKGEIVISLQAGVVVPRAFLKRAVVLKRQRDHITVRVSEPLRFGSLGEIFQSLSSLVRQKTHKVRIGNSKNILAVNNSIRLDILADIFFVIVIGASFVYQEPSIIWYSWLIFTGYLFASIWLREEKVRSKIKLSFSAFSALFILPVASVFGRLSQRYSRN